MRKVDVVEYFGSQSKTARALGITKSAVSQWNSVIPEGMAYKVQVKTGGKLMVDPRAYPKRKRAPAA